jgi:hypothetical protein
MWSAKATTAFPSSPTAVWNRTACRRMEGRRRQPVSLHPEHLGRRRRTGPRDQVPRHPGPRASGPHGRRLRQQVSRTRSVVHGSGAHISKANGGKPVKIFLDRALELTIGGVRPSSSRTSNSPRRRTARSPYGSPRPGPRRPRRRRPQCRPDALRLPQRPQPPDQPHSVSINAGPARAWRAPNNPQLSYSRARRSKTSRPS